MAAVGRSEVGPLGYVAALRDYLSTEGGPPGGGKTCKNFSHEGKL